MTGSSRKERARSTMRLRAAQHRTTLKGKVQAILEAVVTSADEFVPPVLLIPRRKNGKSLSELVSEGRR